MEENEGLQCVIAKTTDSRVVVHDLVVATEATDLEVDETTPSDPMIENAILDQFIEDIATDILSEDVRGLTNPAGSETANLVEKKRKAGGTEFALPRFNVKTKKLTRYVQMKVVV